MRNYSTIAASVQTVRKVGFYPDQRVSKMLSKQLEYILELESWQTELAARHLNGSCRPDGESFLRDNFTPSEAGVISDLTKWWTVDGIDQFREKAFVMANLNRGRCVVIVSNRTVMLDEIKFVEDKQICSWISADEAGVLATV